MGVFQKRGISCGMMHKELLYAHSFILNTPTVGYGEKTARERPYRILEDPMSNVRGF